MRNIFASLIVPRNVAALVDPPRSKKKQITPLNADQVASLLVAIKGDPLETLFHVALTFGLREGEVPGLRWQDLDLENQLVKICFSLQRIEKQLRLVELKTEQSRGTLRRPSRERASVFQ